MPPDDMISPEEMAAHRAALEEERSHKAAAASKLSQLESQRELLRCAWADYYRHRDEGASPTAVTQDSRLIRQLTKEIAELEILEAERAADPFEAMTVEEIIQEQCAAIEDPDFPAHLLEPLVTALARRLGPKAIQRLVSPGLRLVPGGGTDGG